MGLQVVESRGVGYPPGNQRLRHHAGPWDPNGPALASLHCFEMRNKNSGLEVEETATGQTPSEQTSNTGRWVMSRRRVLALLCAVLAVIAIVVGCESSDPGPTNVSSSWNDKVDGYVALVPQVLRSGESASFSFTLFRGDASARSGVTVAVLDKGKTIASATGGIDGKGTVTLELPPVSPGEYKVRVTGNGFSESTAVQIQAGTLLFLETDKPIYKPGQTMLVRLVALDSELKPVQTQATLEIQDAKGIKISKQTLATDEYGTVTAELPLSTEPNLGVWKLTAYAGDATTELDVRVEKYVLPKYEVTAELTKDWFLVDEPITGHVTSKYSYGRAVEGELRVTASRYVGEWEVYATYTAQIDGEGDFSIEPAGYVAGVPEAGGLGNVQARHRRWWRSPPATSRRPPSWSRWRLPR